VKFSSFKQIDYSMMSSYMGRWATFFIFFFIILLAVGSILIKEEDVAHSSVLIGISAFDSLKVYSTFNAFSDFLRSRGCGEIEWKYFHDGDKPSGCDLYFISVLQAKDYLNSGRMKCVLIVAPERARKYSRGIVITKKNMTELDNDSCFSVIVSSPIFNSNISMLKELEEGGLAGHLCDSRIEFADNFSNAEKVYYAVIFGRYELGILREERYRWFVSRGLVDTSFVKVLYRGNAVIDMIVTRDKWCDSRKVSRFMDRFLVVCEDIPETLRERLRSVGICDFLLPRKVDIETLIKESNQ